MTKHTHLPLDYIYAALLKEHGIEFTEVSDLEAMVDEASGQDNIDRKRLGAVMLVLGWNYRYNYMHDEAENMFIKAKGYLVENPLEKSRDTARALWFLAENHYFRNRHEIGRSVFWNAVREFAATVGLFDTEARLCLSNFWEYATGIAKDADLAQDIEDTLEFVDFCEGEGTDGHITVLAS